jgi:hypothetical protein
VAGESFDCSVTLAQALCAQRENAGAPLARMGVGAHAILAALVNTGHLRLLRGP